MAAVASDREGEPGIAGQPRVEEEQHAHRRRPVPARPRADGPTASASSVDRAHGGGADDARARPGEDDEADEREAGDDRLHPPVHGPPAQRPQHAGQHDRDVGPGHGGQVRRARPAGSPRRGPGPWRRVSPTTSPGSSPAGRGSSDPAARRRRAPSRSPPAARCSASGSPTASGGPRAESTATTSSPGAGVTRRRPGRGPAGPGRSSRHSSAGREQQHRGVQPVGLTPPSTSAVTVASATIRGPAGAGQQVRVAVQLEHDRDRAGPVPRRPTAAARPPARHPAPPPCRR